jgi:YVTN family beta-propeller protein
MTDLRTAFSTVDRIESPDVWPEVERRGPRPSTDPRPSGLRRVSIAILALVVGVAGVAFAVRAFSGSTHSRPAVTPSIVPRANGLISFQGGGEGGTWTDAIQPDGSGRDTLIGRGIYVAQIAWSPDGTKIAYVGSVWADQSPDGKTHFGIFTANPDGSDARQLTDGGNDGWPTWSPDGGRIAFSSTRADPTAQDCIAGGDPICPTDIYVMNVDGGEVTRLTDDPAPEYAPAWSPDGGRIALVRTQGHANEIDVMNADGSNRISIVSGTGGNQRPFTWSPDGTQIAFVDLGQQSWDIHVVGADGSGDQKIFGENGVWSQGPIWSPDGTQIAFSSTAGAYPPGCGVDSDVCSDLFVMHADGGHVTRLTQGANGAFGIAWQPIPESDSPSPASALEPRIKATIQVGSFPSGVALLDGFVWVAAEGAVGLGKNERGVVKIDPQTNEVIDTVPVRDALDITAGAGALWVTSSEGSNGVIRRIDPATDQVVATILVGDYPSNVEFGLGAVWVTSNYSGDPPAGAVVRVDPMTNEVVANISIDDGWPRDMAIGEGAVWVSGPSKESGDTLLASSLWRIDPESNQLVGTVLDQKGALTESVYLADSVSVGAGAVWAADDRGNAVRIEPTTGVATTFQVRGGFGVPFMVYEGSVWFVARKNSGLGRLDAQTLDVTTFDLNMSSVDAAIDPLTSTLWIANYQDTVTRIELAAGG